MGCPLPFPMISIRFEGLLLVLVVLVFVCGCWWFWWFLVGPPSWCSPYHQILMVVDGFAGFGCFLWFLLVLVVFLFVLGRPKRQESHIRSLPERPKRQGSAGGGSCDCPLGPLGDPTGRNHISVLSRRDPKGKVPPGGVVAIAFWAPGETQKA